MQKPGPPSLVICNSTGTQLDNSLQSMQAKLGQCSSALQYSTPEHMLCSSCTVTCADLTVLSAPEHGVCPLHRVNCIKTTAMFYSIFFTKAGRGSMFFTAPAIFSAPSGIMSVRPVLASSLARPLHSA